MSDKNLYAWDWIGGGYNQTYAETAEEAIAEGNKITEGGLNLQINMNTFRKVDDEQAFWDDYPIFD